MTYEIASNLKALPQAPYTEEATNDAANLDHIAGVFGSQAILADDLRLTEKAPSLNENNEQCPCLGIHVCALLRRVVSRHDELGY